MGSVSKKKYPEELKKGRAFRNIGKIYFPDREISLAVLFFILFINQHFLSQQHRHILPTLCVMLAVAPFPYVVTRPLRERSGCICPYVKGPSYHFNESVPIRINYQIFKVASKTPSYVQIVQLFCKTGYFLALNTTARKNRIVGTLNRSSESSKSANYVLIIIIIIIIMMMMMMLLSV